MQNDRYTRMGKDDPKKTFTLEEFRRLVIGKSAEHIIAAVGPPGNTFDDLTGNPRRWSYYKVATSPSDRKLVWVWFKDKKADRLEFD